MRIVAVLLALIVAAVASAVAFGVASPPAPLPLVAQAIQQMDRTELPGISRFKARDGAMLAYRLYPEAGAKQVVGLIHGSAGQGIGMHALARKLNQKGIAIYAPDIRGHGDSGSRRGDIDYLGQLDDDLADFMNLIRPTHPHASYTLAGFSAGGAFTVRIAASDAAGQFDHYIAISPAFAYPPGIARPGNGGWATPSLPRIAGLVALNQLGIHAWDGLPAFFFAAPPDDPFFTRVYSYRLAINFSAGVNYETAVKRARQPITLFAGADDEQFDAHAYAPRLKLVQSQLTVEIVPGVRHVGAMIAPAMLEAVARQF